VDVESHFKIARDYMYLLMERVPLARHIIAEDAGSRRAARRPAKMSPKSCRSAREFT
jgi:hypothetical protein